MGGLTEVAKQWMTSNQGNGVSMQSNAAIKKLDQENAPPPASLEPQRTSSGDVGTTKMSNEEGLRKSLQDKRPDLSVAERERMIQQYKKQHGLN
jgi:hypothetical protein